MQVGGRWKRKKKVLDTDQWVRPVEMEAEWGEKRV